MTPDTPTAEPRQSTRRLVAARIGRCARMHLERGPFAGRVVSRFRGGANLLLERAATRALVVLQTDAVVFAQKGFADNIPASGGFPPMKQLLADFIEQGGTIWVCGPCIKARGISPDDLIEEATIMAGAQLNIAAIEADAVFVY